MTKDDSKVAYTLAAIGGLILWGLTAAISGRREPWDAPGYWSVAYPMAILLSGVLAYLFAHAPWRWAVTLMAMQVPIMIFGGSDFGLLPLGLVALAVLSLPPVGVASLVGRVRRRYGSR